MTRQFVLLRHADERPLLQMVGAELAPAGALVSFNGKSFDAPLLETRHLFHRLEWTGGGLPHLDVLHPARRFWGDARRGETLRARWWRWSSQVLGARRRATCPGSRFRPATSSSSVRAMPGRSSRVLEHNRLDLLSLAGLTARLLDLVRTGPGAARHAREALALGRVYARCGLDGRAREAYQRAIAGSDASMAAPGLNGLDRGSTGSVARSALALVSPGPSLRGCGGALARAARHSRHVRPVWLAKRARRSPSITSIARAICPRRRRLRCGV